MDPIVREMYRLLDLGVDGDTLKQWLVMVRMAEQFNASVIWPSLETLCRMTGTRQEETVRKRARTLEQHKAIRIEPVPGRSTRYHLTILEGGHNHPTGSVSPDPDRSEDQQPIKAVDPIHEQKPSRWDGIIRRIERWGDRWKMIARRAKSDEQPKQAEPIEQSGDAAPPLEGAGCPPAREKQPKGKSCDLVPGQRVVTAEQVEAERMTLGVPGWELDGREAPSNEEVKAFVLRTILKGISPAPDGKWYRKGAIVTTEEILAGPFAKANGITAADIERQRTAKLPLCR